MIPDKRNYTIFFSLKKKNIYKYVFCFFNVCGFFKNINSNIRRKKISDIIFNILILLFQLTIFISFVLYFESKSTKSGLVLASICIIHCTFRTYFWINYNECKKIVNQISHISYIVENKSSVPYWIIAWVIFKIIIIILILLQVSIMVNNAGYLKESIFGFTIENVYISFAIIIIFTAQFLIFFNRPLCIFDILYTLVCKDIVGMMNSFHQVLKKSPIRDYNYLVSMYCEIT